MFLREGCCSGAGRAGRRHGAMTDTIIRNTALGMIVLGVVILLAALAGV